MGYKRRKNVCLVSYFGDLYLSFLLDCALAFTFECCAVLFLFSFRMLLLSETQDPLSCVCLSQASLHE